MPTSCHHPHHRRRRHLTVPLAAVAFLLLTPISILARINPSPPFSKYASHADQKVLRLQPNTGAVRERMVTREDSAEEEITSRRRLGSPGSWPPTCRSKCGRCMPCKPVHVPIQPGVSMPLEYYPEAWRCKCGNRLFMP